MPDVKICLMAVPGTGKTTFTQKKPRYRGSYIVDFQFIFSWVIGKPRKRRRSVFLRYLRKSSHLLLAGELSWHSFASDLSYAGAQLTKQLTQRIQKRGSSVSYSDHVINYLHHQHGPICALANVYSINLERCDDIRIAVVMIPLEKHREHISKRREKNPTTRSADFSYVIARRKQLLQFAEAEDIPVYQSFAAAIDDLAGSAAG